MKLLILAACLVSTLSFADEMGALEQPFTPFGSFLGLAVSVGFTALTALTGMLAKFLHEKTKDAKLGWLSDSLMAIVVNAVHHAEVELRPTIQASLSDGKLTADEGARIKSAVLQVVKSEAAGSISEIQKMLHLSDSGIATFVSGLVEQAVASSKK